MHMQPVFKDAISYTNGVSEQLFNQGLCLPSGSNLTKHDLDRVLQIIIKNPLIMIKNYFAYYSQKYASKWLVLRD